MQRPKRPARQVDSAPKSTDFQYSRFALPLRTVLPKSSECSSPPAEQTHLSRKRGESPVVLHGRVGASVRGRLDGNPHDAHHNIHAFALATTVLVAPHAIFLVVPEGTASTVHAPPADLLLLVTA